MQTNLTNAISKKLEIERSIIEIENQVNQKKITHKELAVQLSENERAVKNSLQSIDHLESLKAQRLAELQQADQSLSLTERKVLEALRSRQNAQRKRGERLNGLLKELKDLYSQIISESELIDADGFRRVFSTTSNSIDLPRDRSDRNPIAWIQTLPAYLPVKNVDHLIFLSASDCESRGQKIF